MPLSLRTLREAWANPRLHHALKLSWVAAVLAFIALAIASSWESLANIEWSVDRIRSLLIALIVTLLRKLTGGLRWAWIVHCLGQRKIGFVQSLRIFFISGLAAWLPGTYWFIPGRIVMNSKRGVNSLQTSVSILLEQFLIVVSGGLLAVGALELFSGSLQQPVDSFWWLALVVIGGLLALHPIVLNRCIALIAYVLRLPPIQVILSFQTMLGLLLWSIVVWVLSGLSLLFLTQAFVPTINADQTAIFTAIFAFSFLVGYFTPIAPNGLGVREGVIGLALISLGVPTGTTVVIAALSRLLIIFEDVVWALVFWQAFETTPKASE